MEEMASAAQRPGVDLGDPSSPREAETSLVCDILWNTGNAWWNQMFQGRKGPGVSPAETQMPKVQKSVDAVLPFPSDNSSLTPVPVVLPGLGFVQRKVHSGMFQRPGEGRSHCGF